MLRKILIVDDVAINRRILHRMLRADYEIFEATNGEEALVILKEHYEDLSAVLLDIAMPVMDGYAVLEQMHLNPALSQIPVIVTTGNTESETEIKALALGANDFITKPYVPDIIKHRLKNTINLRETAATVNALQRDKLTGLYNRDMFFQKAGEMIHAKPPGHYVIACFDIDHFKVVNDQYGSDKGDDVLKQVATIFKNGFDTVGGLVSRIMADNFAVLYPASFMRSEQLANMRVRASVLDGSIPPISFSIGRYVIDDLSLSVSAMYDRAALAEASVKGRFDNNIGQYDESMRNRLLHEQEIVNDMKRALEERQFEVWLQPQYNHSTGALIGAEALVRWRHPEKGLIPPSVFIPVFERNGFVYELDKYVWEQTCALLRRWIDAGLSPLPVSVNVSRYDVFRDDLIETITTLVHEYDLPMDLLRLEITESAFAESIDQIIRVVKKLIDNGFTVEIDDFGSGYSSLNTLKDVPAQIVKLDMRFLEGSDDSGRGGNILESIVRMTKWLGMAVIAEGVETIEQADYLKSIGCNYVQGYLYAKPMPRDEYESLIRNLNKEETLLTLETVETLDNNAFWDPRSMDTLIFNTYVGGACIFEWHNEKIEVLRANEKYAKALGGENCTVDDVLNLKWEEHMDADAAKATRDAIERAIETGDDATYEAVYFNLFGKKKKTWLRTTFRMLARTTGRYLLYATNENLTAQRIAEMERARTAEQLQAIMANISGGVTAVRIVNGRPRFVFANEQYYAMLGYTRLLYDAEISSPYEPIHPDDRAWVVREVEKASGSHKPLSIKYRLVRRDGSVIWVQSNITTTSLPGIEEPVQLTVTTNITAQVESERRERSASERMQVVMDNIDSGILATVLRGSDVEYLFANDRYYAMYGYTRRQYEAEVKSVFDLIHPEDRLRVFKAAQAVNAIGRTTMIEYRVTRRDGTEMWTRVAISTRGFAGVEYPVQFSVCTDITAEKRTELQIRSLNESLQNMMNDTPGGFVRLRVTPDGSLLTEYVNENFCRLRGLSFDEVMASGLNDVMHTVHPDDQERVRSTIMQMIATGETRNIPYRLKQGNDRFIPVNAFGRVTKNETGEIFINVYYTDLTEQEKKDFSLHEMMPHLLSAIMKYSTDLVFAKDKEFRYICCSPAFVKFTRQKTESDVVGHTDYEFWTKEEADHFRGDDMRLMESGEPLIDYIEPIPSDDGIQHYCRTSKYILRDGTGEVIGMYGIGRDITEERTTFEQLKLLTNSIPGGIASYVCSPDGIKITYFNDGFCDMMGYTRAEYEKISETGITNITFEEDVPSVMAQIDALIQNDTPLNCTYRVHTKDGGFKWVNLQGVVTGRHGDACTVNTVLYDVTAARLAQEEARIHEQEIRLALSQMGRAISEYNIKTRTLTLSDPYSRSFELPQVVHDVPDSMQTIGGITDETFPVYRDFYQAIIDGKNPDSIEIQKTLQDGTARWERLTAYTVFDEAGRPVRALIAADDTTEQHLQYELEHNRPMLGEENLIGRGLFNLTDGGKVLEYFDRYGNAVPKKNQLECFGGGWRLDDLIIDPDERERFRALHDVDMLLKQFARGKTDHSIEYRRRRLSGDIVWVRNDLRLVTRPGTNDTLLFEYCYVIEEEKTLELINRSILRNNYDFITRINATTGSYIMMGNPDRELIAPELRGEDIDAVSTELTATHVHPDDREMTLKNTLVAGIKQNLEREEPYSFVYRELQPDGGILYKKITQYYLDRARDIIIATREDVTALMQKEAHKNELLEAALKAANEESRVKEREATARLELILNSVNGGMCAVTIVDGAARYVFANEKHYAMFGYTRRQFERALPHGMRDLVHPDDLERFDEAVRNTETAGAATVDVRAYRRDGSLIWVRNISSICKIDGIDTPVYIVVSNDITSEREAADNLRISEEQFRIATSLGGRVMARYDIKSGIYYHNDPVLLDLGFTEEIKNMPEAFIDAGIIAPESVPAYRAFYERFRQGDAACSQDVAVIGKDGAPRWLHADATVVFDADGAPSQAILLYSDITEQREKETIYKRWQQSLQQRPREHYTLFRCNLSKDASFNTGEGSLLRVQFSPEAVTFDDRTREYASGYVYAEDRDAYLAFLNADTLLANYHRGVRTKTFEFREIQPDNALRWLRLTVELVEYPNSTDIEAYLMFEDIDESKRHELRNKERAETDSLTGVLNRTAFSEAVAHMIAGPNAAGSLALLMLDIDGFKFINDTFGHAMGDTVLVDLANTLRSVLRHGDILGRLGGDEFLICLPNMPDDEIIAKKAGQICALLHRSLSLEVYISVSIGIAVYPRDGKDFETLYRKVDAAMYAVKENGKNHYAFFQENMSEEYTILGGAERKGDLARLLAQRKKRRLLIVDDSEVSLKMLAKLFEDDFIIETARDGNEALLCLRRYGSGIAVVLLDLVMPGMDGFAVLSKMRNSLEMRTIPVIVVSSMDEHETSLKTIECGAADFVTKPVNADLLRLRVRSAISRAENDRLRAQNSILLMQNTEAEKYRAIKESTRATVIECDPASEVFLYDASASDSIAGNFDDRSLWDILRADRIATADDVKKIQKLVQSAASGDDEAPDSIAVKLKTPSRQKHLFRVSAKKRVSEANRPARIILTLIDLDALSQDKGSV